jgi:hypothetical protein
MKSKVFQMYTLLGVTPIIFGIVIHYLLMHWWGLSFSELAVVSARTPIPPRRLRLPILLSEYIYDRRNRVLIFNLWSCCSESQSARQGTVLWLPNPYIPSALPLSKKM